MLLPNELRELGRHILGGTSFTSNLLLLNETGYFNTEAESKPLLHLWSLGIEMQFYILFPLIVYLCWKYRVNYLLILLLIAAISFYLSINQSNSKPIATFYFPLFRIWELIAGAMLSLLKLNSQELLKKISTLYDLLKIKSNSKHSINGVTISNIAALFGFILIIFSILFISNEFVFPSYWALFPVFGALLIIWAGESSFFNRIIFSNKYAIWLGLISYPRDLWHWPLLVFTRLAYPKEPSFLIKVGVITLSMILAWITFKAIEGFFRARVDYMRKALILCIMMSFVGILGVTTFYMDGFISRFPNNAAFFAHPSTTSWDEDIRNPKCTRSNDVSYPPECIANISPKILIFGDSHAASLFPGFRKLQKKYNFGITQLTQSGCPPLFVDNINPNRPNCKINNFRILDLITKNKPDLIIIYGAYFSSQYQIDPLEIPRLISQAVERVQAASPTSKVMVIGPVPKWKGLLNRIIFDQWREDPSKLHNFYSQVDLEKDFFEEDKSISIEMKKKSISYFSSYQVFCKNNGCMTHVGWEAGDLTTYDGSHLSSSGANYLAEFIFKSYLNEAPLSIKKEISASAK